MTLLARVSTQMNLIIICRECLQTTCSIVCPPRHWLGCRQSRNNLLTIDPVLASLLNCCRQSCSKTTEWRLKTIYSILTNDESDDSGNYRSESVIFSIITWIIWLYQTSPVLSISFLLKRAIKRIEQGDNVDLVFFDFTRTFPKHQWLNLHCSLCT